MSDTFETAKRTIWIGNDSEGIDVRYRPGRGEIEISGWYDHMVGIEGAAIPLGDFLRGLKLTVKDCAKALGEQH